MVKMDRYKIGIVGGSGFVGSSLAMRLSDSFKIKVFDKRPVPNDIKNKVDFQYCDVRDYNEVKDKIKDVEYHNIYRHRGNSSYKRREKTRL